MGWLYLFAAGLMEVGWPVGFKLAQNPEGFRWAPAAFAVVSMCASFALMVLAQRTIPIGTVYTVWTGIGSVGAVIVGILCFREPATAARLVCVGLIITGVLGLRFSDSPQ